MVLLLFIFSAKYNSSSMFIFSLLWTEYDGDTEPKTKVSAKGARVREKEIAKGVRAIRTH